MVMVKTLIYYQKLYMNKIFIKIIEWIFLDIHIKKIEQISCKKRKTKIKEKKEKETRNKKNYVKQKKKYIKTIINPFPFILTILMNDIVTVKVMIWCFTDDNNNDGKISLMSKQSKRENIQKK